jgi:TonB family protein
MVPVLVLGFLLLVAQTGAPPSDSSDAKASQQPSASSSADQGTPPKPSRPNPDASGIYHFGPGVTPPKVISRIFPEFSDEARRRKVSGVATLSLIVDAKGNPTNVHLFHSIADEVGPNDRDAALSLDQKAVEAVAKYKFSPATYEGKPVPIEIKMQITFQIH